MFFFVKRFCDTANSGLINIIRLVHIVETTYAVTALLIPAHVIFEETGLIGRDDGAAASGPFSNSAVTTLQQLSVFGRTPFYPWAVLTLSPQFFQKC